MTEALHTKPRSSSTMRLLPEVSLVDLADPGVPERLAGRVSDQLEVSASQMRQRLLAASVASGLGVMGELIHTEVTEKRWSPQQTRFGPKRARQASKFERAVRADAASRS